MHDVMKGCLVRHRGRLMDMHRYVLRGVGEVPVAYLQTHKEIDSNVRTKDRYDTVSLDVFCCKRSLCRKVLKKC